MKITRGVWRFMALAVHAIFGSLMMTFALPALGQTPCDSHSAVCSDFGRNNCMLAIVRFRTLGQRIQTRGGRRRSTTEFAQKIVERRYVR